MKQDIKFLISIGLFFTLPILGQDTSKYTSPNGRYDCILVNHTLANTYSQFFLQQLSTSKEASAYDLYDSTIVLDHKDTIKLSPALITVNTPYVSANICFHQRNYALTFVKMALDSYSCTLDILTDHKIKSQMQFMVTLQPSILIRNGNTIYKDRSSNLKLTVQASNTLILENLFIENQPCPRTIMFIK